jgi:hypothetical protein
MMIEHWSLNPCQICAETNVAKRLLISEVGPFSLMDFIVFCGMFLMNYSSMVFGDMQA